MTYTKPPADLKCPHWQKPMAKVCPSCPWWQQVRGINPQTGTEVDRWNSAVALIPMLLIDNARSQRGTQAATESMRNEIVKRMDNPQHIVGQRPSNSHLKIEDHS